MTIKELIHALEDLPEDAQVFVSDIDGELIATLALRQVWYKPASNDYHWGYQPSIFDDDGEAVPETELSLGVLLEELHT